MKTNSVYNPDNFLGRVNYAQACLLNKRTGTRPFDTCFEMGDGKAVVTSLVRRSNKNELPKKAITDNLGANSIFPYDWLETAENYKDVKSHGIKKLAEELRTKSASQVPDTQEVTAEV